MAENKILAGTQFEKLEASEFYFISNKQLIIRAGRERRISLYCGKFEISTAYVMDTRSGDIRQLLIPGFGIYGGQTGLGDIVGLSPDGKSVYMPAFVGRSEADRAPSYSLVKVSLKSKQKPKVVERGKRDTLAYFVKPNGQVIAEMRYDNDKNLHQIFSKKSGKWKEIYRLETDVVRIGVMGLTPDLNSLVIRDIAEDSDRLALVEMSLEDGKMSAPIFNRPDADTENVLVDINNIVYGVQYSGLNPSYAFYDKYVEKRVSKILDALPGQSVWIEDWSKDWSKFVVYIEGSMSSGEFFLATENESLSYLVASRPAIKSEDINPIAKLKFKAEDGLVIPTILTIPADKINDMKNLPAVMLPHGGPEAHDSLGFDWMAQALASRGYLVIQPQFRGSSGFGMSHKLAGFGQWGKKMQSDLTDSIDVLVKKGMVDSSRICIVGASYGGYAALAGITMTPEVYKCAVSINGVSDPALMLKQEQEAYGKDFWSVSYWGYQLFGQSEQIKESLQNISPIHYVEKVMAPVLLIHGENDRNVSIKHSKIMYKLMKKNNKNVEFKTLKGEDHHLSKRETRIEALKAIVEFVDRHLSAEVKQEVSKAQQAGIAAQ